VLFQLIMQKGELNYLVGLARGMRLAMACN